MLEVRDGLNPELDSHIWLIHFLFLNSINLDIMGWVNGWNHHKMSLPDQASQTPAEMRFFSMIEHGARGFQATEPPEETLTEDEAASYGIDWAAHRNTNILAHHDASNPVDPLAGNAFLSQEPQEYSIVNVDAPRCPFTPAQVQELREHVAAIPFSGSMHDYRRLWIEALGICVGIDQRHRVAEELV